MSPMGDYKDFDDCVKRNGDKKDPAAYCATIMRAVEGKHETKTLDNVEVFAKGTWTDRQGATQTFDDKHLDAMIRNFHDGAALKTGHSADDFNRGVAKALGVPLELVTGESGTGQGAVGLGRMSELKRVGERLVAKFRDVPHQIAKMIEDNLYTSVSAELTEQADGSFAIDGVALLGAQRPALAPLENRLSAARVYCFEKKLAQPTIADVRPVPGDTKKKKQEVKMPDPTTTTTVDPNVAPPTAGGAADVLGTIAEALGLDKAKATAEEIINAINALKTKAGEGGAAVAATGPMMAKFEAVSARVSVLEKENGELKREKRVMAFNARAKNWTSFITDTDKEVTALVDMPEDRAEVIAKGYDHCYDVMSKSQFFERIGPAAKTNNQQPVHEFDVKVRKYAADNKVMYWDAMLKCQTEDPKGYESFMAFARKDGFQTYTATLNTEPDKTETEKK